MESMFQLHAVMHVQVLKSTQTEQRNICLGGKRIPLQEQTLIRSHVGLSSDHSSNKQRGPVQPDIKETATHQQSASAVPTSTGLKDSGTESQRCQVLQGTERVIVMS